MIRIQAPLKRTVAFLAVGCACCAMFFSPTPKNVKAVQGVTTSIRRDDDSDHVQLPIIESGCPCIATYLNEMRRLGIVNGHNMSYAEWEAALCSAPDEATDPRPLVVGVGPGTTATRSFAFAANLLGQSVLHFTITRGSKGRQSLPPNRTRANKLVKWLVKAEHDDKSWVQVSSTNFVDILERYHAVFDTPWGAYALDVLRSFPNAKFIMTHRDPELWYDRRLQFCKKRKEGCGEPFILRPLHLSMLHNSKMKGDDKTILTREQVVQAFVATEQALECTVGPDRFLRVDAWHPPTDGDWFPQMANFFNVSLPPPESDCSTVPKGSSHHLECKEEDASCDRCVQWLEEHPQWYDESH